MSQSTTEAGTAKPSRTFRANVEAPEDAPEETAVGHAVFNTTLGQYAGPVHRGSKPTNDEAKALVPAGHKFKIVRV